MKFLYAGFVSLFLTFIVTMIGGIITGLLNRGYMFVLITAMILLLITVINLFIGIFKGEYELQECGEKYE